jgi:ATP-dependent RNA helicase RhlE
VFHVQASHKRALLAHLITQGAWEQVLVFTRTKHGANRLAEYLDKHGLSAVAIHGNKSQNARTKALADFKANQVRVLVATDIAARGLDIDQLPHVVNFELPNVEEDYVHRIGRTGRAGRSGEAISLVAPDEDKLLKGIERMTKQRIPGGDLMGFDVNTLEVEKPEVREPRPARGERPQRGERKSEGRGEKKPEQRGEQKSEGAAGKGGERPRRNRGDQSRTKSSVQSEAASRPPRLPADRDPEVFLDDEIDNFGNRADYVPQQKPQGRARRPGQPAAPQPARSGGQAARSTGGGANAGPARNKSGGRKKPQGGGRVLTPNGDASREQPAVRGSRQPEKPPVIIHKNKESRLPSLEQLEQLPSRPRGERPALLTRNR